MAKPESKSSRRVIKAIARESAALQLRMEGKAFSQIAIELGLSNRSAAYKVVMRALRKANDQVKTDANLFRQLELERLDVLTTVLWPLAMAQNLHAIDRLLRIMDFRTRLMGISGLNLLLSEIDLNECSDDQLRKIASGEDILNSIFSLKNRVGHES